MVKNWNDVLRKAHQNYSQQISNNAQGLPEYIGEADPGTATSATGWRIKKVTYDGSSRVISTTWADGTDNFDKIWDDRASYSYS